MARILGIDLGESRTGVALSDPLEVTCTPLPVIREQDEEKLILRVVALAEEHGVAEIVVGLPRPLRGGSNPQMETVIAFKERLEARAHVPVSTWDERFTSKLARSSAVPTEEHDSVAACYMLQGYLDQRAAARGRER